MVLRKRITHFRYYKFNLFILLCALFGTLAFVCYNFIPLYIENLVLQNFVLMPNSTSYTSWQKSTIPIYSKFYLFNITNAEKILKGEKPILEEIGPFTFQHVFEKVNISWNDQNGTVEYRQIKRWIFVPSLSARSLEEEIVHFNVPLMSAVYQIQSAPIEEQYTAFESLNSLIEAFHMKSILRNKARHLIFDGYHDSLLEAAANFYPNQVSQTKFGWFYGRNNTSTDGVYRIFTGYLDNGKTLGLLDTWNREKQLSTMFGDKCRSLEYTSAGDLQPPFFKSNNVHWLNYWPNKVSPQPPTSLRLFLGDMCRSFQLEPIKKVTIKRLSGYRYRAGPSLFNYSLPSNRCYCTNAICPPDGLYHLGVCAKNSPIFVSFPHFLYADPQLIEKISGLTPSEEDHQFYFDYEQNLAIPLHLNVRLQVNLYVKKMNQLEIMSDWPDNFELYMPQFWSSTSADLDDSTADQLHFLVKTLPLVIFILTVMLTTVSIILLCYAAYYGIFKHMFSSSPVVKYESVTILQSCKETTQDTSDCNMCEL